MNGYDFNLFGKIDRVDFAGDILRIVDYKTGKPSERHALQIMEYGNLLEEMGYTHVEKYLLYVNNLKIVSV